MPDFYETIHRQFSVLLKNGIQDHSLKEFLEEVPFPPGAAPLLPGTRQIAEMLKAVPSESLAIEELLADRDAARDFFQFAISQFPTLRERMKGVQHASDTEASPFYELAAWILSLVDRAS